MKNIKKKLIIVAAGLMTILVMLIAGVVIYVYSKQPDINGSFSCKALQEKVKVIRDNWGVPHIEAQNGKDAYFAYGFTLAQDRLFQMELQRRVAKGELAEILGESLTDVDKMFRTLMFRHTAEAYLAHEEKMNPEALALLDAFLAGINYFIDTQPLPIEFTILRFKPKAFTRLDSLSMMGYMSYALHYGINTDSLVSIIKTEAPDVDVEALFPDDYIDTPVTIMESLQKKDLRGFGNPAGPKQPDFKTPVGLQEISRLLELSRIFLPPFAGSNSWVIAPSRSKSGGTILANDPHMGFSNPGVWYEAHIKYQEYENYGYHLPLIPFPLMAHNQYKGWALTIFPNDDLDLYYETFHLEDKTLVMYKGEWQKVKMIEEIIKVKGKDDVRHKIIVTPHGPIITDFIKGYSKKQPVSLCWVFHHMENPILDVAYQMALARTPEEFENAISQLVAPGLNFSYADHQGNIAWWAVGRIPIRPEHINSKEILDGASGENEITGYLPFEENPHLINPESGMIVTANNKPTDKPVGVIKNLEGYWTPADRAARITELLSEKEKWSLEEIKRVQTDVKTYTGLEMVAGICRMIEKNPDAMKNFTDTEKKAYGILKLWDAYNSLTSVGATLFHFTTYYILKEILEERIGDKNFKTYCNLTDNWKFLKNFLKHGNTPFRNNTSETGDKIVVRGFQLAVGELKNKFGNNVDKWKWGKIHTVEYVHPIGRHKLMNLIYNIGPFPAPGAIYAVNKLRAITGDHDYKVKFGPSVRRLIDYANLSNSYAILPTGNSGNFLSPYYDDQAEMFVNSEYRKVNFTSEQIEMNKVNEMRLLPN